MFFCSVRNLRKFPPEFGTEEKTFRPLQHERSLKTEVLGRDSFENENENTMSKHQGEETVGQELLGPAAQTS